MPSPSNAAWSCGSRSLRCFRKRLPAVSRCEGFEPLGPPHLSSQAGARSQSPFSYRISVHRDRDEWCLGIECDLQFLSFSHIIVDSSAPYWSANSFGPLRITSASGVIHRHWLDSAYFIQFCLTVPTLNRLQMNVTCSILSQVGGTAPEYSSMHRFPCESTSSFPPQSSYKRLRSLQNFVAIYLDR
jgi:hypothetical protein